MVHKTSPALIPLRVLEACAETRSFEKAADALGVTRDAVVQQISAIEAWVGAPLFRRGGPRLTATEAALYAKAILSDGFGRQRGIPALRDPSAKKDVISVSTAPAFASRWLLPRLERFRAIHPDIDIWISVELGLVDFSAAEADIAIRYGAGRYPRLAAQKLFNDTARAIAGPTIAQRLGPSATAEDLLNLPLLQPALGDGDGPYVDWNMWLAARRVHAPPRLVACASTRTAAVLAAAGNGVALASRPGVNPDITTIVADAAPLAHWIVWPQAQRLSASGQIFVQWLQAEGDAQP